MSRHGRFAGSRAGRTGPDAYVGDRESEDLRRLASNQDEWVISSGDSYGSYSTNQAAMYNSSSIRLLPLKTKANRITVSKLRAGFNTLAGKFALYFYEDRVLKLIPGSTVTFTGPGGGFFAHETKDLPKELRIAKDARLFVGFIQTTTGSCVVMHQSTSLSGPCVTVLSGSGIIDFRKEIHPGDLSRITDIRPFPDFAFLSADAATIL